MVWRKLGRAALLCAAGLFLVMLLALLAARLALDRAPQYQAEIKEWIHGRIGYRVAFSHVWPTFRWHGPELYFSDVELRSADGARVLASAAGARVGADLWQLVRSGKLFAGRIELEAPNIVLVRKARAEFSLADEIDLGGGGSLPSLRLDDLPAVALAIRHGVIAVRGWNAALPELILRDVNLTARRGPKRLALTASVNLPDTLGGALDATATAAARGSGRVDSMDWSARVRARRLTLAGWGQLLPEYLYRLGGGNVGVDLTAGGIGSTLSHAGLEFSADDVTTQLAEEKSVTFDRLSGTFTLAHVADRWVLLGRHVRALRTGHRDPDSEFDASWRANDEGLLELRTQASYLRAETLLPLAGLLPQKILRDRLQRAALSGEWFDTHVDLRRNNSTDPWQLDARAQFRGVGFAPAGVAPGIRGLSGSLAGNETGGRVDLDTQQAVLTWPGQFPQPVDLQQLKTTLFWSNSAAELLLATPSLDVRNRDARLHAQLAWRIPADGEAPTLVLAAGVDDGDVADTHAYLPRRSIGPKALPWLNRAFAAGHLTHADVVIQGPLRSFPFRDGSGLFLARAQIDGLLLDYQEGWPRAENVAVSAEFRNQGLTVQLHGGRIGKLALLGGEARFEDLKSAELTLHATAAGDAGDALAYLRGTPLDALAEQSFSSIEATGPLQADVDLFLPFKQFELRHTVVHAHLHGVKVKRIGSPLAATELTGDADIDGAQVARADLRGKLLGGSFQMQARAPRNRPVTRTILTFNGTLSGDALHSALTLPSSIALDGTTDWHGVLRLASDPARERILRIGSSLAGLNLALPQPLNKPAGVTLPTSVDILWPANAALLVRMNLGTVLRGQFLLESGVNGQTLKRAALKFGADPTAEAPEFSDAQTFNVGGSIERLDLAGWLRLYTPDKNAKPPAAFLRNARFEVARIDYLGLSFMDVALDLALTDGGWQVAIGGPNVMGNIVLPADSSEPWKLHFDRLKFVDDDTLPEPGVHPVAANPHAIPAIDFHADDVAWGERHVGEVQATLRKLDDGVALRELTIDGAALVGSATGEWRGSGSGAGRIAGSVTSTDLGATFKLLGYDDVIDAKHAKVDFELSWPGAPSADAFSAATGHVQVALDKGQITGLKPGAGRVVGLASVAALPRRLALDFSDLTDKGLAFDTVRGSFDLHDGSGYTDDVLLKGPAAEIGLIGRVGLKNKDYDSTAVVTGNVGSTLPLAAFAAGPVIGGAVLLFSQVFKQPLKGLARGYYRITGGWDNPSVERIKSGAAAAATNEVK